jgi:hypothetical protein
MKKVLWIFTSLFLTFLTTPVFAAPQPSPSAQPQVILDQLLTGPVPALSAKDLNIPANLAPGFHQLTVEVYDDKGVISSKTALFCKDLQGQLHFDNICPDLIPKPAPKKPTPFDPYSHPDETISFFAVALAVGSALLGMRRRTSSEQADLGGADSGSLGLPIKKKSWGDRRAYINSLLMNSLDGLPKSIASSVDRFSHLLARSVVDARYLRAIFGNLAWLTIPVALYFSYSGMRSIKNHPLPFDRTLILTLLLIGVFDALAGICAAIVYIDFVFASGNLKSQHSIFFTLGFSLLFFAPGLIASKFRPLHRRIKDFAGFWERLTDYVIASSLTGWGTAKLIGALSGLIGYDLPITKSANTFGIYVGLALLGRLLLEEIAWYLYPHRLNALHVELRPVGNIQKLRGIIFKVGVMIILTQPYIGWNRYLAAGIAIFLIPQLLGFIDERLPASRYLAVITPSGVLKTVWLGIVGVLVGTQILHRHLSPKESVLISFVILPIPSFIYSIFGALSGHSILNVRHPKFRYGYRLLSIGVLIILIMQLLGLNPLTEIHQAWQHPVQTWHSLTYKWWPYVQDGWKNISHWAIVGWQHTSNWCASAWRKSLHWISTP